MSLRRSAATEAILYWLKNEEIAALSRQGGIVRNDRTRLQHSLFAGMTFFETSVMLENN